MNIKDLQEAINKKAALEAIDTSRGFALRIFSSLGLNPEGWSGFSPKALAAADTNPSEIRAAIKLLESFLLKKTQIEVTQRITDSILTMQDQLADLEDLVSENIQ